MKTIFITGGVTSSLGKGVVSASLGALLEARGYKVRLKKMDPYLNVDPGTMSPFQHGEVFVTEDGAETDLDLGHYERFTTVSCSKADSISAGRIYWNVLRREREGGYLGKTVQVIPHITSEIKDFIPTGLTNEDFLICEIGGTVGDIEAQPFLEAVRQYIRERGRDKVMVVHLTLLPYLEASEELKTKPTQYSVRQLQSMGINPDLLLCRSSKLIGQAEKEKISLFCNVDIQDVVAGYNASSVYTVPLEYHAEGLDERVMHHFHLSSPINLQPWEEVRDKLGKMNQQVNIAFVGKYTEHKDAYKSITEAFIHAGIATGVKVSLVWIDASDLLTESLLASVDGILVGPGFGERGIEGKIRAVQYAREKKIPFFGICLGMQMAVIEASRNLLGLRDATSREISTQGVAVVGLMSEWDRQGEREQRNLEGELGGTMRLGAYPCCIKTDSKAQALYGGQAEISERHRHRYEVNSLFIPDLQKVGLIFSGISPDGRLAEIVEREDHPWFIGVQFHPELKSRLFTPHPLFLGFVQASREFAQKNGR